MIEHPHKTLGGFCTTDSRSIRARSIYPRGAWCASDPVTVSMAYVLDLSTAARVVALMLTIPARPFGLDFSITPSSGSGLSAVSKSRTANSLLLRSMRLARVRTFGRCADRPAYYRSEDNTPPDVWLKE
ncbi:MAG TPA: hypothetical protein VGE93_23340 [Bryobacteraceae bacterium]